MLRHYYLDKYPSIRSVSSFDRIYDVKKTNESAIALKLEKIQRKPHTGRQKKIKKPILSYNRKKICRDGIFSSDDISDVSDESDVNSTVDKFTCIKKQKIVRDEPQFNKRDMITSTTDKEPKIPRVKPHNLIARNDTKPIKRKILVEDTLKKEEPSPSYEKESYPVIEETPSILDDLLSFDSYKRPTTSDVQKNSNEEETQDSQEDVKNINLKTDSVVSDDDDKISAKKNGDDFVGKSILDELLDFKSPKKKKSVSEDYFSQDVSMTTPKRTPTKRINLFSPQKVPTASILDDLMA